LAIATATFLLPAVSADRADAIIAADLEQTPDGLPVVGSFEKLQILLEKERRSQKYARGEFEVATESVSGAPAADAGSAAPDHSTTNVQVQGVDEADIVKTDGTYLYQTTEKEVRIAQIHPADEMAVVSRISYANGKFHPQEMYVDDKWMVVIGQSYDNVPVPAKTSVPEYMNTHTVKAMVYDITDKRHPRLERELDVEGNYLSSRKIGSSLYLVANSHIDTYRVLEEDQEAVPIYRDRSEGDDYRAIPYNDIYYFPENPSSGYMLVAGIDLNDAGKEMEVKAYLGGGDNLYASPDNLYVAVTEQTYQALERSVISFSPSDQLVDDKAKTIVYRFALDEGSLSYTGKGSVPGRILNQFSMDEHNGYFRIATTTGSIWRTDEGTSKNNLYTLDKDLNISGKLEGIAPGEKIYSVRFMGDRAYMVTFRTVDPLFVIDLKKPEAPTVLGQLKIPGYSDYLHPYDENHLIGFGKEAVAEKDVAYYQGMKIALFDVTDVANPVEKFNTVIGDRGTDSELLRNHKALLFSKEKNLFAFPVTVAKLTDAQKANREAHEYGSFQFQGAYIYRLDLENGFTLESTVTHLSPDEIRKAGDYWYQSENNVRRIITVGDTLYTVSDAMVKAQQLPTHQPLGTLELRK
jgi:uncharacterized secreted protein with C-terminal beta-propeller domain